ncbi:hypothetical protein [Leptothrix ochracea]|uniref:hypothetical protein n=1 Tax=Leptothrix ochracea TaxID=735331 RepID=UPI0034E2BB4E
MHHLRRKILISGALGFVGISAGCAEGLLVKDHAYTEDVTSVWMSSDESHIVFIGNKYHYIFTAPSGLVGLLKSSLMNKVDNLFVEVRVDVDRKVKCHLEITTKDDLSPEESNEILSLGFRHMFLGIFRRELVLTGVRYESNGVPSHDHPYYFKKGFVMNVIAEPNPEERVRNVLMTPLVWLSGGALLLFGVLLLPVIWLLFMVDYPSHG